MIHDREGYMILGVPSTYHELGVHEFKIIFDPKIFTNSHSCSISMTDPVNRDIPLEVKKWGRKMICTFSLTSDIPDGVCLVKLDLVRDDGTPAVEYFNCWVIK